MKGNMTDNKQKDDFENSVLPPEAKFEFAKETPDKDYDIMTNKIQKMLDKTETDMYELIEEYNEKYEDNEKVYEINTCDLSSLFSQLSDFCEDHQ